MSGAQQFTSTGIKSKLLIIKLFNQWWQMIVPVDIIHNTPAMTAGPGIPTQLQFEAETIFNATDNKMLKDRHGMSTLNDAIALKMWLNKEFPTFKYKGPKKFHQQRLEYYRSIEFPDVIS